MNTLCKVTKLQRNTSPIFILFLLLNIGCSKQSENAINFGKFEDGTYTNTFFNLHVSIPDAWHVMDDEARIALMQRGKKIVAGDNKNLNATLNAADLRNLNLLSTSEKPPGSPVSSNPSFIIIAENIKHAPGIQRGSDYHFHTKQLMTSSALDVSFPNKIYEKTINGTAFDVLEILINMGDVKNIQKQYATIINQYALLIVLTYQNNDGLSKLENIIQTIKMN